MKAVILTRGRIATVDDKDFDRVNQFKWHAVKQGRTYYGARTVQLPNGQQENCFLHNFILGVKGVDHCNGDGLENRRQNLRPATQMQNLQGHRRKVSGATSRYRGVSWFTRDEKWAAQIKVNRRAINLGRFAVEEDAARAYDKAAREHFGGFASPNFPLTNQ